MDTFLKSVRRWAGKVKNVPLLGSLAEDLSTLLDMLRDCRRGIYRKLPRGLMIATVIALTYALSPIDLIPDLIPFAGLLDDAAILALLLEFCVAGDLLRYRAWRDPLRRKGLEALSANLLAQILDTIGDQNLAAAFLTEKKQIRLLLCDRGITAHPLPCRPSVLALPLEQLEALGVEDWEQLGAFLTQIFDHKDLPWSCLGRQPFRPEYDSQWETDDFIIE